MSIELLPPIFNSQSPDVNFFEGRLLSGRDLRDQQDAYRNRLQHLGRAIGAGVIEGLEVEVFTKGSAEEDAVLKVKSGVALNAKGQLLELESDKKINFNLHKLPELGDGHFTDCPQVRDFTGFTNTGIYILVMSPASGYSTEQAPKVGLDDQGIAKDCGHRYALKGVQFRVEELKPSNLNGISDETRILFESLLNASDLADLSKLQNLVAHLCFGTEVLEGVAIAPFAIVNGDSAYKKYGVVDDLNDLKRMSDCDVPLAVMHWTRQGIGFLDLWSVRRRPFFTSQSGDWSVAGSERRQVEGEAMLWQFQNQFDELLSTHPTPAVIKVKNFFRYLPPAGILKVDNEASGITLNTFLAALPHRTPVTYVDMKMVTVILAKSLHYAALNTQESEFVWLYQSWQQELAADAEANVTRYLIYASPHMPQFGLARFDLARWDLSNYSRCENECV